MSIKTSAFKEKQTKSQIIAEISEATGPRRPALGDGQLVHPQSARGREPGRGRPRHDRDAGLYLQRTARRRARPGQSLARSLLQKLTTPTPSPLVHWLGSRRTQGVQ